MIDLSDLRRMHRRLIKNYAVYRSYAVFLRVWASKRITLGTLLRSLGLLRASAQYFPEHLARRGLNSAWVSSVAGEFYLLLARRRSELLVSPVTAHEAAARRLFGVPTLEIIEAAVVDKLEHATVVGDCWPDLGRNGDDIPGLIEAIRDAPAAALAWFQERQPPSIAIVNGGEPLNPALNASQGRPLMFLDTVIHDLPRIDFHRRNPDVVAADPLSRLNLRLPFDIPDLLPSFVPAEPKRRSVLFLQQCYYNYYYLARALRARGWDALLVSTEAPDSSNQKFYHGVDHRIYHPNNQTHERALAEFFMQSASRFGIVHTYGVGILSLFHQNHDRSSNFDAIPWDVLELKRRGILIGYSHSGCLDGVSQSSFRQWSPTTCSNCVWEHEPNICSDQRNLTWGRKVAEIADLICTETDPPLDFKGSTKAFRAPLTFAISPEVWRPDLQIPDRLRRTRTEDEIIVYHAMGNHALRSRNGKNVKGTDAVVRAIETLQLEGVKIRLDFVQDVSSIDNRFIQIQADIIVDQLNYGRYGALAREGMMLGKTVVGRINKSDGNGRPATLCIQESPIVDADETTITDVLRSLASDPVRRAEIGRASREHAIRWWSADRLAERFERVYDAVRDHGRPPAESDVA